MIAFGEPKKSTYTAPDVGGGDNQETSLSVNCNNDQCGNICPWVQ